MRCCIWVPSSLWCCSLLMVRMCCFCLPGVPLSSSNNLLAWSLPTFLSLQDSWPDCVQSRLWSLNSTGHILKHFRYVYFLLLFYKLVYAIAPCILNSCTITSEQILSFHFSCDLWSNLLTFNGQRIVGLCKSLMVMLWTFKKSVTVNDLMALKTIFNDVYIPQGSLFTAFTNNIYNIEKYN